MNLKKVFLVAAIGAVVLVFFGFDLDRFLNFEYLKDRQAELAGLFDQRPFVTAGVYFIVYVIVAGLSLPGALIMTLAGGAIFGLGWGTLLVSFASTIGATLAFFASRFFFRDLVTEKFRSKLDTINRGIDKDGPFYLFTLRLVPLFPFFVINLAMGLTSIRTWVFYLVSQVGMLPATLVYINAGTQLASLESPAGILSARVLLSFALLGIFPLVAKKLVDAMRARRVYAGHARPQRFDRNLVVIGAGSAGLVTAYIAAQVRAGVTLIEKNRMGGDCLNYGCVPSKALLRSAKFVAECGRSEQFGMRGATVDFDFGDVMERVQRVIARIAPQDSVERYEKLGVDCIEGEARVTTPWTVEVGGRSISTRNIVVATGATPLVPPIEGLDAMDPLTSDSVWALRERPGRLLVLGGGPIGCELTQAFSRLGSAVTQVEMADRLLVREDEEFSAMLEERLKAEGVRVLTGHQAKRFETSGGARRVICVHQGREVAVEFDQVLVAVGRKPNVSGFGLEELGVRIAKQGTVETDPFLRTNFPNILACGDVAGPYQFTHVGAHQAWYASVNALFGQFRLFRADYSVIPWATFTEPEIARVGLNELEAREKGVEYEVTRYRIDELDRAIADSADYGQVKVLTAPGKDRILGVTVAGDHAGDLVHEFVIAMKHGLGLNKLLGTIHVYPTLAESAKYAAGQWKKAHKPEWLLGWLEKYHRWRRG